MKRFGDDIVFEACDNVEAACVGRRFKLVPSNGKPCVFAASMACDLADGARGCSGGEEEFVWEEVVADGAPRASVKCPCCGFDTIVTVDVIGDNGAVQKMCPGCAEAGSKVCDKCGARHALSGLSAVACGDGQKSWCKACVSAHAEKCPTCGGASQRGSVSFEVITDGQGRVKRVCSKCHDDAKTCSICGKKVVPGAATPLDGGHICGPCLAAAQRDEAIHNCANCGAATRRPRTRNAYYCVSCAASGYGSPVNGYHHWSGKLVFQKKGRHTAEPTDGLLYLGFELESGGAEQEQSVKAAEEVTALDDGELRFHLERDGSIPEYGFELISQPHTLEAHQAYGWKRPLAVLLENGLRSHDLDGRCGLHVHATRSFLSDADWAKVDMFVNKNKTFWERVSRRKSGSYNTYVSKTPDDCGRNASSAGRYSAVNFNNRRTVEFRMFRGTLRVETLLGILGIVDGLCRWSREVTMQHILENDGAVENFVSWLSGRPEYADAVDYIRRRRADETEGEK